MSFEALDFKVRMYDFSCHDLPAKDITGKSDPYLMIEFDEHVNFNSQYIKQTLRPQWGDSFKLEFDYHTRKPDALSVKSMVIRCFDKDFFKSDDFIGMLIITLGNLLEGPVLRDLPFYDVDGNIDQGRIQFYCEMYHVSDISAHIENIRLEIKDSLIEDVKKRIGVDKSPMVRVSYSYISASDEVICVGNSSKKTLKNPFWMEVREINCGKKGMKELYADRIEFKVGVGSGGSKFILGEATLKMSDVLQNDANEKLLSFRSDFIYKNGKKVGFLGGNLRFFNLPRYYNAIDGIHTESGFHNLKKLFD